MDSNKSYILKASFQKCSLEDRAAFADSKCILSISVGHKAFEGKRLEAFFKLIDKSFKSCLIQISDSIQRYTLKMNSQISDEQAYEDAKKMGTDWLNRNEAIIKNLKIPFKIKRWDEWLNHPLFSKYQTKIQEAFENDSFFKASLLKNATDFIERKEKKAQNIFFDKEKLMQLSIDYLKEECAVMCLWIEENCQYEVYPGGRNLAMSATYICLIKPYYPTLLKPVDIRYKKY